MNGYIKIENGYIKIDNQEAVRIVTNRVETFKLIKRYWGNLPDNFFDWLRYSRQGEVYFLTDYGSYWVMTDKNPVTRI